MTSARPVLITGGAGFIGSHIVHRFVDAGHDVIVIDDLSTGRAENLPAQASLIRLDLTTGAAASAIRGARPELIVHCAAQASVERSVVEPLRDAEVNIAATIQVAVGAREAGARQVIYLNTGGALYGPTEILPTPESHPIRPLSPYGLSKWTAEEYLRILLLPSIVVTSLRLANVYGPRQSPYGEAGVVAIFVDRMLRGDAIEIHGDGRQTRDFVFAADVADAVVRAADSVVGGAMNIGTAIETSVAELAAQLLEMTGSASRANRTAARPADVPRSALDVALARSRLEWSPRTNLAAGLEATVTWAKERRGKTA